MLTGLRQQPAMDLRKTCKLLKQFLPTDKQSQFQESYEIMIDAVNDMDVVSVILIFLYFSIFPCYYVKKMNSNIVYRFFTYI